MRNIRKRVYNLNIIDNNLKRDSHKYAGMLRKIF